MVKTFGEKDKSFTGLVDYVTVGFRGQIGKCSAYPHSLTRNAIIRKGDILGTGTGPMVGGYHSELERVMIVGEPTKEQEKYFNFMCRLQEIAFSTIKAGTKCSDVDKAVTKFYEDNNLIKYWRHHTGHAIGIGIHEAPFFDTGGSYDHATWNGLHRGAWDLHPQFWWISTFRYHTRYRDWNGEADILST